MKKLTIWGSAFILIFGIALATSYLCLKHFEAGRQSVPAGVVSAHEWAHSIGLTKDQEKKLEPMELSLKTDIDSLQIKLAQERIALCSLMHSASGDSKELDAYINRIGALEAEQQRRVVGHLLAMRDILTPIQKDKFFAAIMQGICQGCRTSTGNNKDMCGMCNMKKERV